MKLTCEKCGESFKMSKLEEQLIEDGYIQLSDIKLCSDCFEVENDTSFEYDKFTDRFQE